MSGEVLLNSAIEIAKSIAFALAVLIGGSIVIKLFLKLIAKGEAYSKLDPSVQGFIHSLIKVVLWSMLAIAVIAILGIPVSSIVALFASASVAIGLALQGALSNFAGGVMILAFKPFKVGDYIKSGECEGTVTQITIIYTILNTIDNKRVTVPNGTLTSAVVTNYSAEETRRVDMVFTTAYGVDIDEIERLLLDTVSAHAKILEEPEPFARLSAHSASSLDFTVRAWVKTEDYWDVHFDLYNQVTKVFVEKDIEIPFPQMDVHLHRDTPAEQRMEAIDHLMKNSKEENNRKY